MFVLQLFLTFGDIVYFVDMPRYIGHDFGIELSYANIRHSSEWLAGIKATRKWVDGEIEFMPGCEFAKGSWDRDVPLPTCSAWYLLLIGELRLREEPAFSVHTLEQCLFASSGSVFLLVIRWVEKNRPKIISTLAGRGTGGSRRTTPTLYDSISLAETFAMRTSNSTSNGDA